MPGLLEHTSVEYAVSRKDRRERKNAKMSEAPEPVPPTAPNPTPASSTRPGVAVAVVAGLAVLVVGGAFLVFALTRGGGAGGDGGPNPQVVMETSEGPITLELFANKAPVTVKNFLEYVDDRFYDGTIFHRVVTKGGGSGIAVIQGGGLDANLKEKRTRPPIRNEADNDLSNERGTIAMARTTNPDSATSQFFINVDNNTALDRARDGVGYAVFGKVIDGMDVADRIAAVETTNRGFHKDVPMKDVVIKSVRRVQAK